MEKPLVHEKKPKIRPIASVFSKAWIHGGLRATLYSHVTSTTWIFELLSSLVRSFHLTTMSSRSRHCFASAWIRHAVPVTAALQPQPQCQHHNNNDNTYEAGINKGLRRNVLSLQVRFFLIFFFDYTNTYLQQVDATTMTCRFATTTFNSVSVNDKG